jgi:hypothetical protein
MAGTSALSTAWAGGRKCRDAARLSGDRSSGVRLIAELEIQAGFDFLNIQVRV